MESLSLSSSSLLKLTNPIHIHSAASRGRTNRRTAGGGRAYMPQTNTQTHAVSERGCRWSQDVVGAHLLLDLEQNGGHPCIQAGNSVVLLHNRGVRVGIGLTGSLQNVLEELLFPGVLEGSKLVVVVDGGLRGADGVARGHAAETGLEVVLLCAELEQVVVDHRPRNALVEFGSLLKLVQLGRDVSYLDAHLAGVAARGVLAVKVVGSVLVVLEGLLQVGGSLVVLCDGLAVLGSLAVAAHVEAHGDGPLQHLDGQRRVDLLVACGCVSQILACFVGSLALGLAVCRLDVGVASLLPLLGKLELVGSLPVELRGFLKLLRRVLHEAEEAARLVLALVGLGNQVLGLGELVTHLLCVAAACADLGWG
eukprot:m.52703 g.52703  ORF g.52703 m.52703 type:complete len:366 (+) comp13095_c0_seq1:149-1246(+)